MQKASLPLSCKSIVDHLYSFNFIYVIYNENFLAKLCNRTYTIEQ